MWQRERSWGEGRVWWVRKMESQIEGRGERERGWWKAWSRLVQGEKKESGEVGEKIVGRSGRGDKKRMGKKEGRWVKTDSNQSWGKDAERGTEQRRCGDGEVGWLLKWDISIQAVPIYPLHTCPPPPQPNAMSAQRPALPSWWNQTQRFKFNSETLPSMEISTLEKYPCFSVVCELQLFSPLLHYFWNS